MNNMLVSVQPCPSYDPVTVDRAVAAVLADLGGVDSFISPGLNVLVKPNLLAGEPPEKAVTTHPEVVRAVTSALTEAGARVAAGDSPGIGSCRGVAGKTGVAAAVQRAGGTVAEFDQAVNLGRGSGRHFPVAAEIGRADLLVNLPKLKTHGMMVISGAVKNLFGCVVGLRKPGYHFECQGTEEFAALLLELAAVVASGLTIVDAVVVMEGRGPRNGNPRPMGVLIGARDPLAVDFVAAELLGVQPRDVPLLRLAIDRGLPAADPAHRHTAGIVPPHLPFSDFDLPPGGRTNFGLPAGLTGWLRRGMVAAPRIKRRSCLNCGICGEVCPAGAIRTGRRGTYIAAADCIKCYCCEEMCPNDAIVLRKGILNRIWPWG